MRLLVLLVLAALFAGCGPRPAPNVPFEGVRLSETGGVDGRRNTLEVGSDGVALLLTAAPAAGRIAPDDLARLRTVLESEQFRREAAAEAERRSGPISCSDTITTAVTMGPLTVSRTEPCGSTRGGDTPAYEQVLQILDPAWHGEFAAPLGGGPPSAVPLELRRPARGDVGGYRVRIDAGGRAALRLDGSAERRRTLDTADQDTLRVVAARIVERPAQPCDRDPAYLLRIGGPRPVSGGDCAFTDRSREVRALITVVEDAFGL